MTELSNLEESISSLRKIVVALADHVQSLRDEILELKSMSNYSFL
jgi:hypothetical protein